MPPVMHAPIGHVHGETMSMAPPLASPLPPSVLGVAQGPIPVCEPAYGAHPGMLPPMQHHQPPL